MNPEISFYLYAPQKWFDGIFKFQYFGKSINFKQTLFIVHSLKYLKILLKKNPHSCGWVGVVWVFQLRYRFSQHLIIIYNTVKKSTCIPFFLFLLIVLIEVNKCSNGILIHLVLKPVQSPLVYSKCLKMC